MATKHVKPLETKRGQMLRELSTEDNVHELLVLLRSQEDSPDKALLNETKCLLSLSFGRETMQPLPSIKPKTSERGDYKPSRGKLEDRYSAGDRMKTRKQDVSFESSDDKVSGEPPSPTFTPVLNANPKRRLPSLGSKEESCNTSVAKKT